MQVKHILTLLLLNLTNIAFAQTSFYVKPMVGIGITNRKLNYAPQVPPPIEYSGTGASYMSLGIGVEIDKWRIETGIRSFNTGFKITGFDYISLAPTVVKDYDKVSYKYRHIAVPLEVSPKFSLGRSLSILPSISIMLAYNAGVHTKLRPKVIEDNFVTGEMFYDRYKKFSWFGGAAINLEYQVRNGIGIIAGPSIRYMINSMLVPSNMKIPYLVTPIQKNYAFTFDAGVVWSLKKKKIIQTQ